MDIGDKWDSGKVKSDNSVEVAYEGRGLASGENAYWKVRIWDANELYALPLYLPCFPAIQSELQSFGLSNPI